MPFLTAYKLFSALLWQAEQHLQKKDFYALNLTVHVLAEIAMEEFTARKLAHDTRLARRWDKVWRATLRKPDSQVPPPGELVESLLDAAEMYLEEGDWRAAKTVLPKLALLEGVHGVEGVFPGELAERVDAIRMALKDHRG
jgi:hypothetical protein